MLNLSDLWTSLSVIYLTNLGTLELAQLKTATTAHGYWHSMFASNIRNAHNIYVHWKRTKEFFGLFYIQKNRAVILPYYYEVIGPFRYLFLEVTEYRAAMNWHNRIVLRLQMLCGRFEKGICMQNIYSLCAPSIVPNIWLNHRQFCRKLYASMKTRIVNRESIAMGSNFIHQFQCGIRITYKRNQF